MDSGDGNINTNTENNSPDQEDALGNVNGFFANDVVVKMPVSRKSTHYKMDHPRRGLAIIFNHEHFNYPNLKSRSGTKTDSESFEERLKHLGFDVEVYNDLNYKDLIRVIEIAAESDHSNSDCLVVCVMSHGDTGILYAKDVHYKPDNLWNPFTADKCKTLAGKPKLFFIQACQGDHLDRGVTLSRTETDGQPGYSYRIPIFADFLIAYSTIPGFYSWRNTTRGSWFIQALCEELKDKQYEVDLLTLMTFVNQRVAIDYESNCPDSHIMHRQKQIPCITSMLIRLVQFTPKYGKSNKNNLQRLKEGTLKLINRKIKKKRKGF